jgi:hypothetical protein
MKDLKKIKISDYIEPRRSFSELCRLFVKNNLEHVPPRIKFNGGRGALLCPLCGTMVALGIKYEKAILCDDCSKQLDVEVIDIEQ